jgi:hypothetical protein
MAEITVPTYEQIETMLTKLATNYSNLAILFYDIFYNPTPMEVTFQMYDESGVLQTYIIPNRAKDNNNILNGEGTPQNNVEAGKGVIYQDLANGDLYIKLTSVGNTGWTKFVTNSVLQDMLIEGIGSPENFVIASKGTLYIDRTDASLYIKASVESSTGWELISANTANLVDRDLSNLTPLGEAHFAKPDFSNITAQAQAMFDAKENTNNKVTAISSTSTDTKFPSAKAVYTFVGDSIANFADKDFNNITTKAQARFLGNNKLRDCVLEATSIMYRGVDSSFYLPAGTKLLCLKGLNSDNTYNNEVVDITQQAPGVIPTLISENGLKGYIFYEYTGNNTGEVLAPDEARFFYTTVEPEAVDGAVWFDPSACTYHSAKNVNGSQVWRVASMAEIGRWTTNPDGTVKDFIPYYPVRIATDTDIAHVVIETGGTDNNWYRLYKDGWIEAGGYGNGNTTVSFNKNFKTANYTFVASGVTSYTKAVDGVTVVASGDFDWMAKGWVA